MKEHEMRERLERAIRRAAAPAAMGVTMALAGCGTSDAQNGDGAVAIYSALAPDAALSDTGAAVKYMAQMPDAAADSPGVTPLYMAQMTDAGADAADANDTGAAVKYMAQMPDAADAG
jgi:hypothetical protein